MHHFFVDKNQIKEDCVLITGSDVNHIKNVLRMKVTEEVLISDGTCKDYVCILESITDELIIARISDINIDGTELSCKFYLFQGMPKSDKMELIIQKAVELGVFEIIPVMTKRSIVKLDEKKKEAKIKRFNLLSESAAKQSRRMIIPKVNNFMTFKEALSYAREFSMNIIPYENFKDMQTTKQVISKVDKEMKVGLFIGPEGGFDEEEIKLAIEAGCMQISLGKRILRTETAGLALLSILMFTIEN